MLVHAEKRAYDDVRSSSERVYRLQVGLLQFILSILYMFSIFWNYFMQASLDTIQSTEQVREVFNIVDSI